MKVFKKLMLYISMGVFCEFLFLYQQSDCKTIYEKNFKHCFSEILKRSISLYTNVFVEGTTNTDFCKFFLRLFSNGNWDSWGCAIL